MNTIILAILILLSFLGISFNDSFAIISPNSALTLEGSGYAVTENIIKISKIDLVLYTQQQIGSSIKSSTQDGHITLDTENFLASDLMTTILRQGQYIRIDGIIKNVSGDEITIKFFGRLIEESKTASIYGFTGRIIINDNNYKVLYTAKLSDLTKIINTSTKSDLDKKLTIYILKGSSTQGQGSTIGAVTNALEFRNFSQDKILVNPGTTITFVNDDVVSHNIISGKATGDRYNQYIADGRISTGNILPGQSINITFDNIGLYRLYDPNYQWMNIISYVFPKVENSVTLSQSKNSGN